MKQKHRLECQYGVFYGAIYNTFYRTVYTISYAIIYSAKLAKEHYFEPDSDKHYPT